MTPQWVNDDGTTVKSYVGYVNGGFVLSGNKKAFENTWSDSVEWVVSSSLLMDPDVFIDNLSIEPHPGFLKPSRYL